MSATCELCMIHVEIENQLNMLDNLLNLESFNKFDKKKQLCHICENCVNFDQFIPIHDFFKNKTNSTKINQIKLYVSNCDIYVQNCNKKKLAQLERKIKLMNTIKKLRIEYNKQICDQYIKFGSIEFEQVIEKLSLLQKEKNDRLYDLLTELQKCSIEYDSRIPSFKKYIAKGGNIKTTIEKATLEKILAENTNYLSRVDNSIDSDIAIELSIGELSSNMQNETINKYVQNKNKIIFG